jgi:hypothetical protein
MSRYWDQSSHIFVELMHLMYLANITRLDISFVVNILATYNASLMKRHWVGVKNILRYLESTKDLALFY